MYDTALVYAREGLCWALPTGAHSVEMRWTRDRDAYAWHVWSMEGGQRAWKMAAAGQTTKGVIPSGRAQLGHGGAHSRGRADLGHRQGWG